MLDGESSDAAEPAELPEPDGERTEVSVQHHLSVRIGEQDGDSSLAADGAQQPHHDPLLAAKVSSPEPPTLGDRHLRSLAVSYSHLSFKEADERTQGSMHGGQPSPPVVVTNEAVTRIAGVLRMSLSPVPDPSRADSRKVESGSSVVQTEGARDFTQELSHKHEFVRPGVPGEWSFESRQVPAPGVAAAGVTIGWSDENVQVLGPQPNQDANADGRGSQSVAAQGEEKRLNADVKEAAEGDTPRTLPAIPANAAMSKINVLAHISSVPVAEDQAEVTTRRLPADSGASIAREPPARMAASCSKTEDGREEFKVCVTSSRSGGSIHLEGLILTDQMDKADAVHSFNIAAVRNVHEAHNSAQSQEGDTECLLHRVTSSGSLGKAAEAPKARPADPQVEEFVTAQSTLDPTAKSPKTSQVEKFETAQKIHPVAKNEIGGGNIDVQLPLQNLSEQVPRTGSKVFRAVAVPTTTVPAIGSVTKVVVPVPRDGDRLEQSQVCGPFVPTFEYETHTTLSLRSSEGADELDLELVEAKRGFKTASRVSSRASTRPRLMEEFLFSSTTVGLTDKERIALPPVRDRGMSLSRVHLPPSDQITEFGFSATTFGLAEEERREIGASHSVEMCLERSGRSIKEIYKASGTSGIRCPSGQKLGDASTWNPPGSNKQYSPVSGKIAQGTKSRISQQQAERNIEFGFSATTMGLGKTVPQINREDGQTASRSSIRQVPAGRLNSSLRAEVHYQKTGDVSSARNVAAKFITDSSRDSIHSRRSPQGTQLGNVVPRQVRFVRVESTITEEDSLDSLSEQPTEQRYTSQKFSVTPSKATLGPGASLESFTAGTIEVNRNKCRTPNREQLIDELPIVSRLSSEHDSIEASFQGTERVRSSQFVDTWTGLPRQQTGAARMTPLVGNSHTNFEYFESTFPSMESTTDFATAQETAYSSFGAGLEAFSASSSSSVEAGGVRTNQAQKFFANHEAQVAFPNAVNSYDPFKGVPTGEIADPFVTFGQQRPEKDFRSSCLANYPVGSMARWPSVVPPRESIGKVFNPSFDQRLLHQEQGGDQESVPYSRYRVPSEYTEDKFRATQQGAFQTSFPSSTPAVHVRGALQSQMNAVVATENGELPGPREMLPQHESPRVGRASLHNQPRLATSGLFRRGDWKQNSQGQDEWVVPRASVCSQHSVRMGANFGPNRRRSPLPNRRMMHPLQQRAMQSTYRRAHYSDNSPYVRSSWHGVYHEDGNLAVRPPVFARTTRSPYSEALAEQATHGDYRISRRRTVFRAESLSTFESHENGDELHKITGRASAAFPKRPSRPEKKVTSTKTVQTESRRTSTSSSSVNGAEGFQILTPKVKAQADLGGSNATLNNTQCTRAATQTEPYQLAETFQPPPYCGTRPCPGYINQNFVCPPYPPHLCAGPHTLATFPLIPTAEAKVDPLGAHVGYLAQSQIRSPPQVNQPGAVPDPAGSSSERAGTCPLSSCFRGLCGGDEYYSEERPTKPSSCGHRKGQRGRSPLPPPAPGSTFTVGYVMNSENELSPVLMPVNADTVPKALSEAGSARAAAVDTHSRGAASSSEAEKDRIAKVERRVLQHMAEIEKSIREYDERRKEEGLEKEEKPKDKESKKKKRRDPERRRPKRKTKDGKKLREIHVAKAYDNLSSSDTDSELEGLFSWSRTSKNPKDVNLRRPREEDSGSFLSVGNQTDDDSRSYCTSKEKFAERNDNIAISEVAKREGSTEDPTFAWAMRRKSNKNKNPRRSPCGSIADEDDCKRKREESHLRLTLEKYDASPNESPKHSSSKRRPKHGRAAGTMRSKQSKNGSSPGRFSPSPDPPQRCKSDAAAETALLAKVRVELPRDKKTQRRWSRTEMHRSASYGTAASPAAPSSTKERRTRFEHQCLVQGSLDDKDKSPESEIGGTPPSLCASVCSLFKSEDKRQSPSPRRARRRHKSGRKSVCESCRRFEIKEPKLASSRRPPSRRRRSVEPGVPSLQPSPLQPPPFMPYESSSSARFERRGLMEDVTEEYDAVEKKPAPKGSMLSSILSWFSSRSADKQDQVHRGSGGKRGDSSSSSFKSWITEKERALKEAQAKLSASKNAGGPDMPRELYFQDEGGRRWVIRCSPSDSAPESYLRKREPATVDVVGPPMEPCPPPYGTVPLGTVRCTFGGSREKPGASYSREPIRNAPSAEPYSYVQYTNGGPRMQGSGKPTLSVADPRKDTPTHHGLAWAASTGPPPAMATGPGVPPSGLFPDVPDWILRISRGRKHRASSRGSAPSERAHAEEHTSSSGSTKRPTKKKSEVSFREEEERLSGTKPEPEAAPPQPERKQEPEPPPPPALTPPMQQSLAPPPIIPRRKTEESFLHEFFEEMDERGMAALTARSDKRRSSLHEATSLAAAKMAEDDSLLNARGNEGRKTSAVSGELGGPPQLSLNTDKRPKDTGIKHLQPPEGQAQLPSPEINDGGEAEGEKADKLFSAKVEPKAAFATAAEARIVKGDRKASGTQDKAAIGGPLATGDPAHTNYALQQKAPRKLDWSDPLSYKCPTLQEVVGYAIVTAVVLLGLVLLVSVPRMRSRALNLQE